MRDEYDLSDAIRHNPYLEKLKNGYSVTVHYGFIERDDEKSTKMSGGTDAVKSPPSSPPPPL